MNTGSVTSGSGDRGWIVCGAGPGMAKSTTSAPGFKFACVIASRREPGPASSVFVTVNAINWRPSSRSSTELTADWLDLRDGLRPVVLHVFTVRAPWVPATEGDYETGPAAVD